MKKNKIRLIFISLIFISLISITNVSAKECYQIKKKKTCNNNTSCKWVDKKCRVKKCATLSADACGVSTDKNKKKCKYTGSTCYTEGDVGYAVDSAINSIAPVTNASTNSNEVSEVSGCGIFGSKSTKLIKLALNCIRIGAPILVIFLGVLDFFKILMSGEEKTYKEAFNTFLKRMGAVIALIFVPYAIVLLLKISGVLSEYNIADNSIFCFFDF